MVSRDEWLTARRSLLVKEKELTRARDKPYTFEGPDGTVGRLDLFEGRPQLVMHHFMFGPDWDQGCPSCSSAADGIGRLRQLHVRNTSLVAVSRAPYQKIVAFRERMGSTSPPSVVRRSGRNRRGARPHSASLSAVPRCAGPTSTTPEGQTVRCRCRAEQGLHLVQAASQDLGGGIGGHTRTQPWIRSAASTAVGHAQRAD